MKYFGIEYIKEEMHRHRLNTVLKVQDISLSVACHAKYGNIHIDITASYIAQMRYE